ncbi:MAG: metal-dependent hydrolase [Peptococcaceae bacterium BRH_c8a]|nr:MAG: metal-dependent hydrolase [Peptococcaceae bacterium BRH_c8a]
MKVTFLGHACFLLEGETTILIDPFITGNPVAKIKPEAINVDLIFVTHGHADHLGDAVAIAKNCGATIVSVFEVATYCGKFGVQTHAMHIGGSNRFGPVQVKLTPALHGSGLVDEDGTIQYLGNPCGFVFNLEGKTIYHSGDTGLFSDLSLIGKRHPIDLAMLPIGDNFTMGPDDALEAVKLVKPHVVIPMHYNTWPLIAQNPAEFKQDVETDTPARVVILQPGDSYEL